MTRRPLRAGPWPGLRPLGALVLLGCAALIAVGLAPVGEPHQPLPDLVTLAVTTFVPLMLAARALHMPGAAAAACGAYLLPRTLVSLVNPTTELPPLLLVPAVAFELAAWLRPSDVRAATRVWPWRSGARRSREGERRPRRITWRRGIVAGAVFGITLSLIEPPFAMLLGADRATWSGSNLWLAAGLSTVACAALGATLSARGTAS
jgi:hypothetical protein